MQKETQRMHSVIGKVAMAARLVCGPAILLYAAQAGAFQDGDLPPPAPEFDPPSATEPAAPEGTESATPESALPDPFAEASTYGPTSAGESLSTIAIQLSASSGIHVAQVMWALYDASRSAFKGSINKLRVGATLDVPSRDAMTAVSISQARINIRDAAEAAEVAATAEAPAATPSPQTVTPVPTSAPVTHPTIKATPAPVVTAVPAVPQPAVAKPALAEIPATAAPEVMAGNQSSAPQPTAQSAPAEASEPALAAAEDTAPASDDDAEQSPLRKLLLPLIAVAAFVLALLAGTKRRRREREAAQQVEMEAAARKRAELLDLARGATAIEPTQVMPTYQETAADEADSADEAASTAADIHEPREVEPADADEPELTETRPEEPEDLASSAPTEVLPVVNTDAERPAAGADDEFDEDSDLEAFDDGIKAGDDIDSALDLASGYADMGEIDRARSLLNMVLSRGSAEQQAEARRILETLD